MDGAARADWDYRVVGMVHLRLRLGFADFGFKSLDRKNNNI